MAESRRETQSLVHPSLYPSSTPPSRRVESLATLTHTDNPAQSAPAGHAHLHDLIAHYLSTHYAAALPAFLSASGAPDPTGKSAPNPDLQTLVADAASAARAAAAERDLASRLAATHLDEISLQDLLARPLPAQDSLTEVKRTYEVAASNLLAVTVANLPFRKFDTSSAEYVASSKRCMLVSGADRDVRVIDYDSGEVLEMMAHKAPVLSIAVHPAQPRYIATGGMDGVTAITDSITLQVIQTFQSGKFVVRVAFSPDGEWFATASYDHSITLYRAQHTPPSDSDESTAIDPDDDAELAAPPSLRYTPVHTIKTDTNPETLLFHPLSTYLLYTVRGSHEMGYCSLSNFERLSKSFNPHPMDTHVSFAVLDMALHPSGRMVACITGDHAGTAGERVLIYGIEPEETERLACLWTGADSDTFVLPRIQWIPDGRGVVTSSPTGDLVLLSTNGEVRSRLKVHAARGPGTSDVVRDIAVVGTPDQWEVVSVGYDRCVKVTRGCP